MRLVEEITKMQSTEIPTTDDFKDLKNVIRDVKVIIEKIDFTSSNEIEILINLCDDSLYFLESKKPLLFFMYVSHALRELTEKFFGEAKSVGTNDFFNFSEGISLDLINELTTDKYGFIENIDTRKIKLKRLIKIEERDDLLRISIDEGWHRNVWELNNLYAENDNSKRNLGTKQFYERIPAKYSVSSWTYEELIKTRKILYKKLSSYAHGGKVKEIVEVLEKSPDKRNEKDNEIIGRYIEDNKSIIDIFRPFENTTNEKIKRIDELLNE